MEKKSRNISNIKRKNLEIEKASNKGFAALFTITVIGAAGLLIALSAATLGLGELEQGYVSQKGSEAFALADGCMEETFRRIRLNTSYGVGAGTINLSLSNGSCEIDVTDLGGGQRRIDVLGTADEFNKRLRTQITLTGNVITLDSWEELAT